MYLNIHTQFFFSTLNQALRCSGETLYDNIDNNFLFLSYFKSFNYCLHITLLTTSNDFLWLYKIIKIKKIEKKSGKIKVEPKLLLKNM